MKQPIRVLVVEDSLFMRNVLCKRIEADARFKVIATADNGLEGVEKALNLRPDVMTLDIEMPQMNGIEALKRIVKASDIPVIMVSAQTEAGAQATLDALAIGAVDFVPKANGAPFIHEKLAAAAAISRGYAQSTDQGYSGNSHQIPKAVVSPIFSAGAALREPLASDTHTADGKARRLLIPTNGNHHKPLPCPAIVIIGSSTGGPQALEEVLRRMPAELPVPVIIAQHMPPTFTAALAARLNRVCPPTVIEARHGDEVQNSVVYVAPGGMQLRLRDGAFDIAADAEPSLYKPSIGIVAESAHEAYAARVLAVMLTGIGSDGAQEFAAIRKAGGWTIAQDRQSAVVFGMPRALIEVNGATEVLPLREIGARIQSIVEGRG